jgi:two-component system CheB/CheR fusion protein
MEHCDMDEAGRAANGIRDAIADYRFLWEGKPYTIGVSIGVVAINEDSSNMIETLKEVDAACYMAKKEGRNRIHIHHEQDDALAVRRGEMHWVAKINQALEENRFHIDYQPIVAINTVDSDKPMFEFLLRLEDEDGSIVLPDTFLRAAERYNLSIQLDQWVLSTALAWLSGNSQQFATAHRFTFNLSGPALGNEDFLNFTLAELGKHKVSPDKICFEITEAAVIGNLANTNKFIHALKEVGCCFAIDDFGIGLSSFSYLKALAVEYLKISSLYTKHIMDDPVDLAMVKSINEIGHVMGKKTIAEFTEDELVLAKLRALGVDYAQGSVIGKPVRIC